MAQRTYARLKPDTRRPGRYYKTLGEWYAFRGMDHWAVALLLRAQRTRRVWSPPLAFARCYWNLGQNNEAFREFHITLWTGVRAFDERTYLEMVHAGHRQRTGTQTPYEALLRYPENDELIRWRGIVPIRSLVPENLRS